ncbi:MAG: NADH-quinone oxidoreductase subunit C [Pseudomonadota bacterium]
MNEKAQTLGEYIAAMQAPALLKRETVLGELTVTVRRKALHGFLSFLKSDEKCAFQMLVDICGADYPDRLERFDVVYNLLSLRHNHRIRVKVMAGENAQVDTVTDLYSSAGWFERETWDMFGIFFNGNPDLRRILTDYGFEGHPLRKDFPLTGFVELRYDEAEKRLVYEPVKLAQDFRNFDFTSPWEGMTAVQAAGDGKNCKPKTGGK